MTMYTTILLPPRAHEWLSACPFTGSLASAVAKLADQETPIDRAISLALLDGPNVPLQVKKAGRDPAPFSSLGRKAATAACLANPILSPINAPLLNILTLCHWMPSPHAVASWILKRRDSPATVTAADAYEGVPPDAARWYAAVYMADLRGRPTLEHLLASVEGARIEQTGKAGRFYLVSCPAWEPTALYPGLPVDALVSAPAPSWPVPASVPVGGTRP